MVRVFLDFASTFDRRKIALVKILLLSNRLNMIELKIELSVIKFF